MSGLALPPLLPLGLAAPLATWVLSIAPRPGPTSRQDLALCFNLCLAPSASKADGCSAAEHGAASHISAEISLCLSVPSAYGCQSMSVCAQE